jgi:hypothetical protein
MAKTRWTVLPGGRIKRWKKSEREDRCYWLDRVPPREDRNLLNRRERRRARCALFRGDADRFPYVHPREMEWYW